MKMTLNIISLMIFYISNGQVMNENYILFDGNEENETEYIEFKNDSILIRKPKYPSPRAVIDIYKIDSIHKEYKYSIYNDSLIIFDFFYKKNSHFKFNSNHFENDSIKKIYVLRSLFDKTPDSHLKYKNEFYWMSGKDRKREKILKKIDHTKVEYKLYLGYNAFKNFGYKYVYGVFEILDK